jgi:hypothetical protein
MKKCTKCKTTKPFSDFGKDKRTKDNLNRNCKKCATAYSIDWWKRNKDKKRNYNYLREYNITLDNVNALIIKQNNCCAICNNVFKNSVDTCVDHCHNTKKVRGLLCNHCNRAIGLFRESVKTMQNAINYLNK